MPLLKDTPPKSEPIAHPFKLTITDGWNFGIGFGLALTIALPIILGVIGCAVWIFLLMIGYSA